MKQLPNIITSARAIAAIVLTLSCILSPEHGLRIFLPLFMISGISDLLDGYLARRFGWCTEFGAKLDSVSDLGIFSATALFLWINARPELSSITVLLLVGGVIQTLHIVLGFTRHGQYPSYHTNYSRLTAYILYFGLIGFWISKWADVLPALTLAWMLSSLEGIAITLILKRPHSDLADIRAAILANRHLELKQLQQTKAS